MLPVAAALDFLTDEPPRANTVHSIKDSSRSWPTMNEYVPVTMCLDDA
jgi:hypothetical protein